MKQTPIRFTTRLLSEWKHLGFPLLGGRVLVGVSGGADSTALLLGLDELIKAKHLDLNLTVAHLNHGLRGETSVDDALWVERLADRLGHGFSIETVNLRALADQQKDNLEQAARRARYSFLSRLATSCSSELVLTAHTLDDQAETVLLRLMRGSGPDGLGGIKPSRSLEEGKDVILARPLVRWARRADTEAYCAAAGIAFRNDAMNHDESFARVRVRKQLLPLMREFNPRIDYALSRTASLLREDSEALQSAAEELLEAADDDATSVDIVLRIAELVNASASVRRRALRNWLARMRGDTRRLEMVHLVAVEKLLFGQRGGLVVELPGGSRVERKKGLLYFHSNKSDRSSAHKAI
jgi:tRNA(Ile)-lysidine synthase